MIIHMIMYDQLQTANLLFYDHIMVIAYITFILNVFSFFNSFGAIRYFGGALARYIYCAPKYHKTRSIVYFGPLYLDN